MVQNTDTLLIAVDGGGSGCRSRIATSTGRVLGEGAAGPANATTDLDGAIASTKTAIDHALRAAGLSHQDLARSVGHIGLAGALTPEVTRHIVSNCGLPRVRVTDDLETAFTGALGGRNGVLVSVGTGSVLAARREGKLARIGGWGLQVSDQASGAWLGRKLLERVLLCQDGLQLHSDLTQKVFKEMGGAPMGVVEFAAKAHPADFAKLAPHVVAASGDFHGSALMREGADYLRHAVDELDSDGSLPICLTGGLGPFYADWLPAGVQARLVEPAGSALDGALRLACDAAGGGG